MLRRNYSVFTLFSFSITPLGLNLINSQAARRGNPLPTLPVNVKKKRRAKIPVADFAEILYRGAAIAPRSIT